MKFINKNIFLEYTKNLKFIGQGSEGICYLNPRENKVYKIYHQFYDELEEGFSEDEHINYEDKELMKFSNIKNNTFIFPTETIKIGNETIGYKLPYIKAKNLYKQNPLSINLSEFEYAIKEAYKQIEEISEYKVLTYDMMFNILYNGSFYIIDHSEYTFSNKNSIDLFKQNRKNFDKEIYYFLTEGLFDEYVSKNKNLNQAYSKKEITSLEYLKLLRFELTKEIGKIETLGDAASLRNRRIKKDNFYRAI